MAVQAEKEMMRENSQQDSQEDDEENNFLLKEFLQVRVEEDEDEGEVEDQEDEEGQATCEGGEHLPFIGLMGATIARAVQDFCRNGEMSDYQVSLSGVVRTAS